jgi:putative hydrolase of the HAD superfamily
MSSGIKAILYDLGDVFFEAHLWRKWMYDYCLEKSLYSKSFAEFYLLYETYLEDVYCGRKEYDQAYKEFVSDMKLGDSFIEISFDRKRHYENTRTLYKGVKETLQKIHNGGIKNIVVTDNEASEDELRRNILKRFEINEFIDKVITSKETGVKKPDPYIFEHALKFYSLKKEEVLFVGHDKDEIDGATELGLRAVEYNNYLGIQTSASYKIENFSDLFDIIPGYHR